MCVDVCGCVWLCVVVTVYADVRGLGCVLREGVGCIQRAVHEYYYRLRPYDVESTTSHPNREVKLRTASIVLWWGTTREVLVL